MADRDVIDIVIRARDESSAGVRAAQAAIDELTRAQAALAEAERAKAAADRAAADGSDDQAEALRRQAAAAEAAAAAERRLAEAERAAAAAAARVRGGAGGGGGAPPPGGAGGGGPDDDRLNRVLDSLSRDLGGFAEQIKALIPVLANLKTTTTATAAAIAAAGDRLRRGAPPPGPNPPPPPPGPNPPPPPGPGPNPPPPPPPGSGRNAAAQSNLIQQLIDVGTQAAGGANPLLILIQQGPQIAMAISAATSATALFSGMLATMKAAVIAAAGVLGPLAVVLAAVGTAYLVTKNANQEAAEAQGIYNVNVEDAEAKLAAMASRLDEVNGMLGKVRDRVKDNAREIAVLSGEITKEEASRQSAIETVEEQAKAETQAARDRLKAQYDLVHVQENALKLEEQRSGGWLGEETREELRENIRVGREQIEVLKGELNARKDATAKELEQIDTLFRLRGEKEAEAAAGRRSTAAVRSQVAALTELQQALRAALPSLKEALIESQLLAGAMAEGGDIEPINLVTTEAISRARELQAALDSLAPSKDVLTDLEKLQLILLDIQRANIQSGGALSGLEDQAGGALMEAIGQDLAVAGKEFADLGAKGVDEATKKAATFGTQIGAVIGGDISGVLTSILSATGPVGAAVAGTLEGLSALGEQGAGKTSKMITGFLSSISKGLTSLPALIVKLVPSLLVDVLPDLVVALVGAIPRLVVAILIELPVAIVRGIVGWWRDIGGFKGIARSIADGVRDWWTSTWDRIKSWLRDIFTPGNDRREQRRNEREARNENRLSAGQAFVAVGQAIGDVFTGDNRSRSGSPGNSARAAGPTIVLQGDLTPDFVPALGRRLDRYNGPGGLRSGTTILGST
jgi:hypothetical protein